MREVQRKRSEEARATAAANPPADKVAQSRFAKPDMQQAQASVAAAGQRAGAYFSSWGSWAAEKRKSGWSGRAPTSPTVDSTVDGVIQGREAKPGEIVDAASAAREA